jgi:exodeoxyribonuclease V beta subunit
MSQSMSTQCSAISSESLDVLRFPLYGSRLIEASAGTGKTYTIAALYVRLVLGHGNENAYARALTPPEILVVTFTEAATQELRDRIRTRLAEAAEYFFSEPTGNVADTSVDVLLRKLRDEYPPEQWSTCARKLQLAAEWMDEAAVSTIHGWCNRMLREHAFDSGSLFTQTLETDQSELIAEVIRDYWRTFMVPLEIEAAIEVRTWWQGPADLQKTLGRLIEYADIFDSDIAPSKILKHAMDKKQQRLAELKAPWGEWIDELQALLDQGVDTKSVDGRKLQRRIYLPWLDSIRSWITDPHLEFPDLKTGRTRLTPEGIAEAWTKGEPPTHPSLGAISALQNELSKLPNARNDLLRHAAIWVASRFSVEQERHAMMGFNDLLSNLDQALKSANGGRLADIIRRQFPVALIDEFQDTDPVQYRIFDAVYRVSNNDSDTAFIMIGDPKQAIYAFRGADIYTYLAARRASAGRLYTLKNNFRSTKEMVGATNRLFNVAEIRNVGAGAFMFRTDDENPVPFVDAVANGRKEDFQVNGALLPALTAWCLPSNEGKALSKDDYFGQMAGVCASEMVRLLNFGQTGHAGFVDKDSLSALRPADMAVIVNNRKEADAIRTALSERGVRSVYLSDRDSVFDSAQAAEVQHWLSACAEPDDARLLRAALATQTLNLSWFELDKLNHDELAWDARVMQFKGYHDCWRRQGVLPMLRHLLNDFHIPARLQGSSANSSENGERVLTDLLHLAELLQQASIQLDGEHALIRYLAEQQDVGSSGGDSRQVRLESDADLVKVVTVYKSKGLEYPLVFIPFACNFRKTKSDDVPLKYHNEHGDLLFALSSEGDIIDHVDRERLGEDLRKIYVALTRARYATWIGIAPINELERSAFGYLLAGGQAMSSDSLEYSLNELHGNCDDILIYSAPLVTSDRFVEQDSVTESGSARKTQRSVREDWWIASYSSLKSADKNIMTVPETLTEDIFIETLADKVNLQVPEIVRTAVANASMPTIGSLHDLPRGADIGIFLHDLLEWVADQGFEKISSNKALLRDTVARRCKQRDWLNWIDPLTTWLQYFLTAQLQLPEMNGGAKTSFSLQGITSSVAEMEFWFSAHATSIESVDKLVRKHILSGIERPALKAGTLNGMLKGFIDLVFEHEGRFYVADYKSNWLGQDDAAYTQEAMQAVILDARYELQYVLYIFALHRLLKSRLPAYDYDLHVGGVVYIFLRGLNSSTQGLFTDRPPRALIEGLDQYFSHKSTKEKV